MYLVFGGNIEDLKRNEFSHIYYSNVKEEEISNDIRYRVILSLFFLYFSNLENKVCHHFLRCF